MATKLHLSSLTHTPRTTHASVTEQLRKAILSGALPGGTRLVQSELAEALNVSITPVREALRELGTQGLIDLDAFRCAVVHTPSLVELEELYELRGALIPLTIQKGVQHITPQELAQAETLLRGMESETEQARWVEFNRQFHHLLEQSAQNSQLQQTLQRLSDLSAIYVNLSFSQQPLQMEASNLEHRQIFEAYKKRQPQVAIDLTLAHINATLAAARQVFRTDPIANLP